MENGWYNAPSKPRQGRSAERFYYDSRIQGIKLNDLHSVDSIFDFYL